MLSLTRGIEYTYTILARWNEKGHEVTRKQEVDVQAGSHAEVDFLAGPANAETTPVFTARDDMSVPLV